MPAEILRLSNFDFINQSARTELALLADAGQKNLSLANASGLVAERFIVIAPNTERAELVQIDSLSDSVAIMKNNLVYNHPAGEVVIQLVGNQLKVYRAANVDGSEPVDSSFEHLETSPTNPIAIQVDQPFTAVTDPNGGPDYWYKVAYLNSETESQTDLSLSVAVRGGDYGHYTSLATIREQAGFSYIDNVTDYQVSIARNHAEAEINARIAGRGYSLPITVEVPVLSSLAALMGAGHLLNRSYGAGAEGTTKEGERLLKQGRGMLDQLDSGTLQLVDIAGNVLPNTANSSGTSVTIESGYREATFRMEQDF